MEKNNYHYEDLIKIRKTKLVFLGDSVLLVSCVLMALFLL